MQTKLFEVRDRGTFIPVLGVLITPDNVDEEYLCRRAGYGVPYDLVILTRLTGADYAHYDPWGWNPQRGRTMHEAHNYISRHWHTLDSGDVVDVEFILGETPQPKQSESVEYP